MFFKACKATAGVVLTLALVALIGFKTTEAPNLQKHYNPPVQQMTIEQTSSHMVVTQKGLCTATAIGPHALLTAGHCYDDTKDDLDDKDSKTLRIDYSFHKYNIMATAKDDRDHIILLIDGPALKNIETVKVGVPVVGENERFYGYGDGISPSSLRSGKVLPVTDPSDVDAADQMFDYSNPVYHGDSGSAIYNDKGEIIGLVTWTLDVYDVNCMAGYALGFVPKAYDIAAKFDPLVLSTFPK